VLGLGLTYLGKIQY